jgi:TATA-box binding protein (TBP) (component of TFIID and TFIIIB)
MDDSEGDEADSVMTGDEDAFGSSAMTIELEDLAGIEHYRTEDPFKFRVMLVIGGKCTDVELSLTNLTAHAQINTTLDIAELATRPHQNFTVYARKFHAIKTKTGPATITVFSNGKMTLAGKMQPDEVTQWAHQGLALLHGASASPLSLKGSATVRTIWCNCKIPGVKIDLTRLANIPGVEYDVNEKKKCFAKYPTSSGVNVKLYASGAISLTGPNITTIIGGLYEVAELLNLILIPETYLDSISYLLPDKSEEVASMDVDME